VPPGPSSSPAPRKHGSSLRSSFQGRPSAILSLLPDPEAPDSGAGGGFYRLAREESYVEVLLTPDNQGADLAPGESTGVAVAVTKVAWDAWIHPETGESLPPRNERTTPVEGASLTFSPTGTGQVSSPSATTDVNGHARLSFTGGTAGSTLEVTAVTGDGANATASLWLPSDWSYVRTEGLIEAALTGGSGVDQASLQLSVTYSTWDVFRSNRAGEDITSNHSSSPAEGASVAWSIDSGDGSVSGNSTTDAAGLTTATLPSGEQRKHRPRHGNLRGRQFDDEHRHPRRPSGPGSGRIPRYQRFPSVYNPLLSSDWNNNGYNDGSEFDSDGDGVWDFLDSHPSDPSLSTDRNYNGYNDGSEIDSDSDGVWDFLDSHPGDSSLSTDWDNNGYNQGSDPPPPSDPTTPPPSDPTTPPPSDPTTPPPSDPTTPPPSDPTTPPPSDPTTPPPTDPTTPPPSDPTTPPPTDTDGDGYSGTGELSRRER